MFSLSISPIAFDVFGLSVYWYGIFYAFAMLSAWFLASFVLKKLRANGVLVYTKEEFDKFMLFAILSSVIGARLGHVLFFEFEYYIIHPIEIFFIRNGGLTFHGGVIGLVFFLIMHQKKTNVSWKVTADILSFAAPLGLGFGRIANFINQELYGKISTSKTAVIFTFVDYMPRYPVQLFEAFFEGFLNFWIIFIIFRLKGIAIIGTGKLTAIFSIIYSSSRFVIEFYKEVETHTYFNCLTLTVGQILSFILLIFGILVLYLDNSKRKV